MSKSKKILITGATGFVGAGLTRRLVKDKENVNIILRTSSNPWRIKDILNNKNLAVHYGDLINARSIDKIVQKMQPRIVYHLAAYGGYPFQKEGSKIFKTNILGTLNLLKACSKIDLELFINTGSSSEYGTKSGPMLEKDLLEPNSYYAVAKAGQTLLCQHMARENNLPIITLRLFSVYGNFEEPTRLIPTLITSFLNGKEINLVSPETVRDFIFVDDVIDAYLKATRLPKLSGEIFNIGTGHQHSIKEVVSTVEKIIGTKVKTNWRAMPPRPWDTNIWLADNSKARRLLKWQPKNNLEQGLRKTINWFKKNSHLYK